VDLLHMAYSADKAAAFAYQGHAASVKSELEKAAIKQIEIDEWNHQHKVLTIMNQYGIKPSRHYEIRFHIVGKLISTGCNVIGWFMPFYFAGCLESGNLCKYFRMIHFFHELGIREHGQTLYEMGVKEKEHKDYFYAQIKGNKKLPLFERLFSWADKQKFNDLNMEELLPSSRFEEYYKT
jgi:hypothetical protein